MVESVNRRQLSRQASRLLTMPVNTACDPLDQVPVRDVLLPMAVNEDCASAPGRNIATSPTIEAIASIRVTFPVRRRDVDAGADAIEVVGETKDVVNCMTDIVAGNKWLRSCSQKVPLRDGKPPDSRRKWCTPDPKQDQRKFE
jgi:hypothetical protein